MSGNFDCLFKQEVIERLTWSFVRMVVTVSWGGASVITQVPPKPVIVLARL